MSHVLMIMVALAAVSAAPASSLPATLDLSAIRALPVQHDGRWPPLDTVARDIVREVTGTMFHRDRDPVLMLLAWTFDPQTWQNQPLIRIGNAELRAELELSSSQVVFSYSELVAHRRLHELIDGLSRIERGRKMNPLESKVSDINGKLITLQGVFADRPIRPIPDAEDKLGAWKSVTATVRDDSEEIKAVQVAWLALREAFMADDKTAFSIASAEVKSALVALPTAYIPNRKLIDTELYYNELRPYRKAWKIMIVGTLLACAALVARRRAVDVLAVTALVVGFGILTYGLWLRWQIAGRIPASNMYESLLFLSWGIGAFAIVSMLFLRNRVVPLTSSAMGALALILADCLPMNPFIRPMPPVLQDTVWMTIHVPVIMVSYSVLALGVMIAHVQLVLAAAVPKRRDLAQTIDSWHYWYIHVGTILLLAGIVTGSMWGASSWGRYWGWDPKEVWSLVALLAYLAILHVRIDHDRVPLWAYALGLLMTIIVLVVVAVQLGSTSPLAMLAYAGTAAAMAVFVVARGHVATAVKSILAFWMIIMTYLGVNYVLGIGLHSYGFGTGAMVFWMSLLGGIDLGLVLLCSAIYLARRNVWGGVQ